MTIDPKLISQWLTEDHSPEGIAQRAYDAGRKAGMLEAAGIADKMDHDGVMIAADIATKIKEAAK